MAETGMFQQPREQALRGGARQRCYLLRCEATGTIREKVTISSTSLCVLFLVCLLVSSTQWAVAQGVLPVVPPTDTTVESAEAQEDKEEQEEQEEIATAPEADSNPTLMFTVIVVGLLALVAAIAFRRKMGRKLNLETGEPE